MKRGEKVNHCKSSAYVVRLSAHLAFSLYPSSSALTYSCQGAADFMLYPLVKDLQAPNVGHHLIIYCSHREHFAHHCNSATPGMRDSDLGREQVLHKGSKHKVLNIMFLISFGQR